MNNDLRNIAKHWAIDPDALHTISESHAGLSLFSQRPLEKTRTATIRDGVAVIPITGVITPRLDVLTIILGGTAMDCLARDIQAALAGTFTAMGKSPEIAGTAINMMSSRLKLIPVQTGAARAAFDLLGISMTDYIAMLESGRGKDAIMAVLTALTKVQGIKRSQIMVDMFGEQANRHINSLVEGLDKLKENFALVGDQTDYAGSMQKEFAARSATTENNLQLLKNQMAILATNVGATLLPAINSLAAIFGKAAGTLATFAEKHPTLVKYIGMAVAGLASAKIATFALGYGFTFLKGGLLSIMGVFTKVRTIFSMAKLGIGALAPVLSMLNAAFIASPIGWIVMGIAGAAFLIIKYWTPISAFFKRLFEPVVAVFKQVWNWISGVWEKAENIFNGIKEWVKDSWVGKVWNWAFGNNDEKESTRPQTKIGSAVSDNFTPANQSAVELPHSTISNANQSNVSVNAPITINTHAGMNATDVATQVSRELDAREQSAARRQRGANYD